MEHSFCFPTILRHPFATFFQKAFSQHLKTSSHNLFEDLLSQPPSKMPSRTSPCDLLSRPAPTPSPPLFSTFGCCFSSILDLCSGPQCGPPSTICCKISSRGLLVGAPPHDLLSRLSRPVLESPLMDSFWTSFQDLLSRCPPKGPPTFNSLKGFFRQYPDTVALSRPLLAVFSQYLFLRPALTTSFCDLLRNILARLPLGPQLRTCSHDLRRFPGSQIC